ncbi:phosphotransferase family protein [Streptomyces syringium]|uniref:Phosphotransferase enzyme family protein n=1 Tax=Streptomyces syringium TaxID=76729 RepID=A0ABS4XWS8_9ACTN|nr:hypothetical protein [Streptomyces syringium]MBP2400790.1 hypothetical protein [Streptomyces syringium]
MRAIRASLAAATALPQPTLRLLHDRLNRLEADLAIIDFALPEGILQGDPQHRNALHNGTEAVLCDWDTVSIGQPEWDLVTIEIHCRRFRHGQAHYNDFAATYGFDVTQWPGFATLRDPRELRMITTNARKAHHTPGSLAEVQRRTDGLLHEDTALHWNIL